MLGSSICGGRCAYFPLYYAVLCLYVVLVLMVPPKTPADGVAPQRVFYQSALLCQYTSNWFVPHFSDNRIIFYFAVVVGDGGTVLPLLAINDPFFTAMVRSLDRGRGSWLWPTRSARYLIRPESIQQSACSSGSSGASPLRYYWVASSRSVSSGAGVSSLRTPSSGRSGAHPWRPDADDRHAKVRRSKTMPSGS